ncbi:MAG: T9SS type A sorting domain-containing protein, partial [Candidatus Aenigmatarchaeota archaeon]
GCHRWQNRGINNSNPEVINTWWYTNSEQHTFILDIDPNKWRMFPEIINCTGQNGVEVKFKFWHEIPFSSITWNISTNPPNLLGQASDTVIDNSDPEWTTVYLTFPVINNGNAVVISFQISAYSDKYPYCNEIDTLICAVLPIIWNKPLSGISKDGYNVLRWSTAIEQNIDGFWIERSKDGLSFYTIGYVRSKGISSEYTYEDKDLFGSDRWLYRLRANENSGQVIYSNTVEIISDRYEYCYISYDKISNRLIIKSNDNTNNAEIVIIDMSGRIVFNTVTNEKVLSVYLESGVYIVKYNNIVRKILVI